MARNQFTPPARGLSRLFKAEFQAWVDMRKRCEKETYKRWADYGGRGILVCERWRASFRDFLSDMGPRPSPDHSLDRINNDGHYSPGNCRWATRAEQMSNRRAYRKRPSRTLTHDGQTLTLAEWAERLGVKAVTIGTRLRRGWPLAIALSAEPYNGLQVTINGRTQSLCKWIAELGVPAGRVRDRIQNGWSAVDALLLPKQKGK